MTGHTVLLRLALSLVLAAACGTAGAATPIGPAGTTDPSFNGSGQEITVFGTGNAVANAVAVQPDGKIVVAGYASNGTDNDFAVVRYNKNGSLDQTGFNPSGAQPGTVVTDFAGGDDRAYAVAIQPDKRILVAGYATVGSAVEFAVARYNPDGSPDTTFNNSGMFTYAIASGEAKAYALALQLDGGIVLAGSSLNANGDHDVTLMRLTSGGLLDSGFGTTSPGITITDFGAGQQTAPFTVYDDFARSIAVQPDDTFVVAGYSIITTPPTGVNTNPSTATSLVVARYLADGSVDNTFPARVVKLDSNLSSAYGVVVTPADEVVIGGVHHDAPQSGGNNFLLARFTSGGALDTGFGTGMAGAGTTTTDFSGADDAEALVLQPDGKVVAGGSSGTGQFALARYDTTGYLDTRFNAGGTQHGTVMLPVGGSSKINALALQPDGKIIAVGDGTAGTQTGFAVARFFATDNGAWGDAPPTLTIPPDNAAAPPTSTSAQVTMAGLGSGVNAPVTGDGTGRYSKCVDAVSACSFTSGSGAIHSLGWVRNGDQFYVQQDISGVHGVSATTTLYVGGLVAANNLGVILGTPTAATFTSTINHAPVIAGTPATTVQAGSPYSFTPTGADQDDPPDTPLTYSSNYTPTWATLDPATGTLSGTPTNVDVGSNPGIQISVTDALRATTSLPPFAISVTAPPPPPSSGGSGGGGAGPLALLAMALAAIRRRR